MRVTRAAQRNERALTDIEPNTTLDQEEPLPAKTPAKTPAKKGKAKGAKKGSKSKKAKADEEDVADIADDSTRQADAGLDVDQDCVDGKWLGRSCCMRNRDLELIERTDINRASNDDEQPRVPNTPSVRLTRRQLAKLEEEEAQCKQQHEPFANGHNVADDVGEQVAKPAEMTAQEDTPAIQGEPKKADSDTKQPARRARRKQAKLDEDSKQPSGDEVVQSTTEQPDVPTNKELEACAEIEEVVVVHDPIETEPKPMHKAKRLTRRQQVKAQAEEDTQQQLQSEQSRNEEHLPQSELVDEAVEESVGEPQVDADVEQKSRALAEPTKPDVGKVEDLIPAVVVAKPDSSAPKEDLHSVSHGIMEEDAKIDPSDERKSVESPESEALVVELLPERTREERPMTPTDAEFEADFEMEENDTVVAPTEQEMEAEPKMLSSEKPFETGALTPIRSQDMNRRTSRSSSKSTMRLEESISAIDRLEEDLESIGSAIPDLAHTDDEKLAKALQKSHAASTVQAEATGKTPMKSSANGAGRTPARATSKTSSKVSSKAPVTTKAPTAVKAPLLSRLSKAPSVAPKSVKPTSTFLARASSVRVGASKEKDIRKPSTETADYLASKRRPISLSFPTPPPPPKGRAPTKPTFQLSSESVAAKLRAQKEERLKREAEGAAAPKQRPISMPPPPRSTKPPTVASFQLPGEATAAKLKAQKEERLKRMQETGAEKPAARPISMPPPPKSAKQVTKPSFQLPGEATAARLKAQKEERLKRMEEAEAAKKAALAAPVRKPIAHRPRPSMISKDAPGPSIPPPPRVDVPQRSTSIAKKRSSIVGPVVPRSTSTASANRNSALLTDGGKSTVAPTDVTASKSKGKQVFNRDKMEKDAEERERKEKEEAAKRARAEAAERGRIASREWAERQRKKMMGQ